MRLQSFSLIFITSALANKAMNPFLANNIESSQHERHIAVDNVSASKLSYAWYRNILRTFCNSNSIDIDASGLKDQCTLHGWAYNRNELSSPNDQVAGSTNDIDTSTSPETLLRRYLYILNRIEPAEQSATRHVSESSVSPEITELQNEEIPVNLNRRSLVNIQIVTQNSNQQKNENNSFRVIIPNENHSKKSRPKRKQGRRKPTKKVVDAKGSTRRRTSNKKQ